MIFKKLELKGGLQAYKNTGRERERERGFATRERKEYFHYWWAMTHFVGIIFQNEVQEGKSEEKGQCDGIRLALLCIGTSLSFSWEKRRQFHMDDPI